jgi:hypothetical protein
MYESSHLWVCYGTPARLYFCIYSKKPRKDSGLLNRILHHSKKKKKRKEKKRKRERKREELREEKKVRYE